MSRSDPHANRAITVVCAFAVSFSCMPAAAWANGDTHAERSAVIRASVQRVAALESHRLAQPKGQSLSWTATGQPQGQPAPELERGSFFRTPAGIAVLAVFGIGVGYALYSSSNDRIRSTGR